MIKKRNLWVPLYEGALKQKDETKNKRERTRSGPREKEDTRGEGRRGGSRVSECTQNDTGAVGRKGPPTCIGPFRKRVTDQRRRKDLQSGQVKERNAEGR